MKLKDIINNLDMSEDNRCDNITWDMERFLEELNLSCYGVYQDRDNAQLKSFWLSKHLCTDTYVGTRAYFLEGTFVALSTQNARKSDEIIQWVSAESQVEVRNYILSLDEEESFECANNFIDMDSEVAEGYSVNFVGELLCKNVSYEGRAVEVVKQDRWHCDENGYKQHNFHNITILDLKTGLTKEIDIRDVVIPWNIK